MIKVPFINLIAENQDYFSEIEAAVYRVIRSGQYVLGKELDDFEEKIKLETGAGHCVGVANGTDALVLAMQRLGLTSDDEVITVSNSYLATVSSIMLAGAKPVLCDVDKQTGLMSIDSLKRSLTSRSKAVILVHLGGYLADVKEIAQWCTAHNLTLIEDCAQAFGSRDDKKHAGCFGEFGAFSAHPLKNLASMGDAGFIITNDDEHAAWLRKARSHGHINRDDIEFPSMNSRLDEIQAAILNIKLKYYRDLIEEREKKVLRYYAEISNIIKMPEIDQISNSSHHLLMVCINNRDKFIDLMHNKYGIELKVHYPRPYHRMSANSIVNIYDSLTNTDYRAERIVSLPIAKHINDSVIDCICDEIGNFAL